MEYRVLGKTGLKVSVIGMGCRQFGGVVDGRGWTRTNDKESIATIHHAESLGVNLLDTATTYGSGHSEEVMGEALKDRRDRFVVATKVKQPFLESDWDEPRVLQEIVDECEASLRRLRTDYIDVYQMHAHPREDMLAGVMNTMSQLKKDGKVRWIGISTDDTDFIGKLLGLGDLATLQVGYSLANRSEGDALQLARKENLGTLIRSPLAMGVLSGRYFDTAPQLDPEDMRRDHFASEKMVAAFEKLSELRFLTEGGKRTMVQAALRFVIDTEGVTSVIPGTNDRAQLEVNAGTSDAPPLTPDERTRALAIVDASGMR